MSYWTRKTLAYYFWGFIAVVWASTYMEGGSPFALTVAAAYSAAAGFVYGVSLADLAYQERKKVDKQKEEQADLFIG